MYEQGRDYFKELEKSRGRNTRTRSKNTELGVWKKRVSNNVDSNRKTRKQTILDDRETTHSSVAYLLP